MDGADCCAQTGASELQSVERQEVVFKPPHELHEPVGAARIDVGGELTAPVIGLDEDFPLITGGEDCCDRAKCLFAISTPSVT